MSRKILRYLLPDAALVTPQRVLVGQVCVVSGQRIAGWCAPESVPVGAQVEEFPGELWAAAPILLHAHLESFDAPSAEWSRANFADWVQALLGWRHGPGERLSAEQSARASLASLADAGCGLVVTSVSEPGATVTHSGQDATPICLAWTELFEPDPALARATWQAWLATPQAKEPHAGPTGVALHAPFSVSPKLAQMAFTWAHAAPGRRISIHLGEHADERAFLAEHAGPLAELFRSRERPLPQERWSSPVAWLEAMAPGSQPHALAVHASELRADELRALHAKQVMPVFCPGTHRYFDRPRPAFADAGLTAPLLGCDSRASNAVLDPFSELEQACELLPEYSAQAWWSSLTTRAAASLGRAGRQGSLLPGREGLFLRLPDPLLREPAALCDSLASPLGPRPLARPGCPPPLDVRRS